MPYTLGVDLGTTYTAAALVRVGRHPPTEIPSVETVTLGNHGSSVPSVLHWRRTGEVLVGDPAVRKAATQPGAVAREFKRTFGSGTRVYVDGVPRTPQALTATLLKWVVDRVTEREGSAPAALAVTYPASWGGYRLELLQQAVEHAGVHRAVFVTEPQAAALRYASTERFDENAIVGVYDLGGGTFDAAVVRRTCGGFELLGSPTGIEQLGGLDIDDLVFRHALQALGSAAPVEADLEDEAVAAAVTALRRECVEAKETLSDDTETVIRVNLPAARTTVRLTREELEDLARPLLADTVTAFRRAVELAGLPPDGLTRVLLAGGASRMPLVTTLLSGELGHPVAVDAHPKQVVAGGAALWAAFDGILPAASPAAGMPAASPPAGLAAAAAGVPAARGSRAATTERIAPAMQRTTLTVPPAAPAEPMAAGPPSPPSPPWVERPSPHGSRRSRRDTRSPDLLLLGAAAVCGAALLAVCLTGLPHAGRQDVQVTNVDPAAGTVEPGAVDLGRDVVAGIDGRLLSHPTITPRLLGVSSGAGESSGGYTVALKALDYVVAGPVEAEVLSGDRKRGGTAIIRPKRRGLLTLPGIAALAGLLFAGAYLESLVRAARRRRAVRATTFAGAGLLGMVAGVALAVLGWTLASHLLTVPLVLLAALLGDAVALGLTVVAGRRLAAGRVSDSLHHHR